MDFVSTRDNNQKVSIKEALLNGLAKDGGLYVPEILPKIVLADFIKQNTFLDFAKALLAPFFKNSLFEKKLPLICEQAFNFDIPLEEVDTNTFFLSLNRGPTLSFKDVGARFLAGLFKVLNQNLTIIVATSGDTGSAVASAFSGYTNIKVIVLFPKDKIAKRQEAQITGFDKNILPLAVLGTFDDCQDLVKEAFSHQSFRETLHLTSANSINIGRLLPQMTYLAYWSTRFYQSYQKKPGMIVPSGNLGHMTACFWAKQMGFPIGELVIATNANQTLSHYISSGQYKPQKAIPTLANAMDVGAPSNFERLQYALPTFDSLKNALQIFSVSDKAIEETIIDYFKRYRRFICPHTATACFVRESLSKDKPFIVLETADSVKFDTIIEPLIDETIPVPEALSVLLKKNVTQTVIEPNFSSLKAVLS